MRTIFNFHLQRSIQGIFQPNFLLNNSVVYFNIIFYVNLCPVVVAILDCRSIKILFFVSDLQMTQNIRSYSVQSVLFSKVLLLQKLNHKISFQTQSHWTNKNHRLHRLSSHKTCYLTFKTIITKCSQHPSLMWKEDNSSETGQYRMKKVNKIKSCKNLFIFQITRKQLA